MIAEQLMLEFVERSARNQAKIGNVFLVLAPPRRRTRAAQVRLERDAAQMLFLRRAAHKALPTHAKNRTQYAITGRHRALSRKPQSRSMALRALMHGERQSIGTSPLHHEPPHRSP